MTTLPSGLPVVVQRADSVPLAVQISAQLEAAVTGGVLHAGDRLPSSRDLAVSLGVSRTVVTNAYARLFAEGWLEGRHGSGTYVADVAAPRAVSPVSRHPEVPLTGKTCGLVPAGGPDTMAGSAIGAARRDSGGHGGRGGGGGGGGGRGGQGPPCGKSVPPGDYRSAARHLLGGRDRARRLAAG